MYELYLNDILFPIAPSKLKLKISGNNKTITLINEGEVNLVKKSGLTEITFDLRLPLISQYKFAKYKNNKFQSADYFLKKLESFKNEKKPIKFIFIRKTPNNKRLFDTNMYVTIEKYDISEEAKDGLDITVEVTLKQWREYGYKKLVIKNDKKSSVVEKKRQEKDNPKTYTIQSGDNLWSIARRQLGNQLRWKDIYDLNANLIEQTARKYGRQSSSTGHWIYPGTVLKLPKS